VNECGAAVPLINLALIAEMPEEIREARQRSGMLR
jgi:hypothetical protein